MAELVIMGPPQSSFVWATRIATAQKGVPHRLEVALPHTPAVDAIHPLGRVPVMRHGDLALCESRAIVSYVDSAFPGPRLQATDAVEAAKDEAWISLLCTGFDQVLVREYILAYYFPGTPDGSPDKARIEAALPKVKSQVAAIERAVVEGRLLGEAFRVPDAWLIPPLYYLRALPDWADISAEAPATKAALAKAAERDSVVSTMPPPPSSAGSAEAAAE
ncbi:MAG: glutathione S-transferase family protein [Pseudomonadota bacterium]